MFQLAVGAGGALLTLIFQLPMRTRGAHHAVVFPSAVRALDSFPHHYSRVITSSRALVRDGLFVPRASRYALPPLLGGDDWFPLTSEIAFDPEE